METPPLDAHEIAGFDSERRWLAEFLGRFGNEFLLTRKPEDLPTLQSLLDAQPFASGDEASLEVLGAAFGDVVAETLGFQWVAVDDEYGADFAIKHPTKMVFAFPRDMIVKRVENGEEIDLTALYHGVIAALREQIDEEGIAESVG
jgi:hypothetical protein